MYAGRLLKRYSPPPVHCAVINISVNTYTHNTEDMVHGHDHRKDKLNNRPKWALRPAGVVWSMTEFLWRSVDSGVCVCVCEIWSIYFMPGIMRLLLTGGKRYKDFGYKAGNFYENLHGK